MESAMEMGGNDEMTRLEMEMMGENVDPTGLGQPTGITLRVFINMDEDDDGDKGIDLKSLFKLAPGDLPFNIDVKIEDHNNCSELIMESIDSFNNHLASLNINAKYRLSDDPDQI